MIEIWLQDLHFSVLIHVDICWKLLPLLWCIYYLRELWSSSETLTWRSVSPTFLHLTLLMWKISTSSQSIWQKQFFKSYSNDALEYVTQLINYFPRNSSKVIWSTRKTKQLHLQDDMCTTLIMWNSAYFIHPGMILKACDRIELLTQWECTDAIHLDFQRLAFFIHRIIIISLVWWFWWFLKDDGSVGCGCRLFLSILHCHSAFILSYRLRCCKR